LMPNPSATLLNVSHIASMAANDTAGGATRGVRMHTEVARAQGELTIEEGDRSIDVASFAHFLSHGSLFRSSGSGSLLTES
jgi:hypothetical protein